MCGARKRSVRPSRTKAEVTKWQPKTGIGVFGGNWSDPTGWSGGSVPAAGDKVQLSQALNGLYTVHLDANEGAYAALTVSAANATLALYHGGLTLSISGATT